MQKAQLCGLPRYLLLQCSLLTRFFNKGLCSLTQWPRPLGLALEDLPRLLLHGESAGEGCGLAFGAPASFEGKEVSGSVGFASYRRLLGSGLRDWGFCAWPGPSKPLALLHMVGCHSNENLPKTPARTATRSAGPARKPWDLLPKLSTRPSPWPSPGSFAMPRAIRRKSALSRPLQLWLDGLRILFNSATCGYILFRHEQSLAGGAEVDTCLRWRSW